MKLSAPKMVTWVIAVVLGLLGVLGRFVPSLPLVSHYLWFMTAGWLLLAVATVVEFL